MRKPIYVFFFLPGTGGGTATLSIRIGEYLVKKRYEVLFICQKITDTNSVQTMSDVGIKVYCWEPNKICSNMIKKYGEGKKYVFLVYRLEEYLMVEKFKENLQINKSILYVVHKYGLIKGTNQSLIARKFINRFYSKIIRKMLDHKSIIFMDKTCIEETEKYYGIKINEKDDIILNLPIKIQEFDPNKINDKTKSKTFNIITIARASFPFKGYIIGLIDDFKELCDVYDEISLTIITFGKDEDIVAEKIKELPSTVQSKISLIGQTPYEKLKEYFDQMHLNIGMGTTILDAANHGVPSLVVQSYTYNNNTSGFFHMYPEKLGAYEDKLIPTIKYIKKVIQMNEQEYKELCKIEHKTLEEHYNIECFANYLIDTQKAIKERIVNVCELKANELMLSIKKMIKR